ncbi:MAG: TRAP transporter small permease [Desulfobacterales bacterium]|jgi:TRAP-type C4-dicarboxylate transport system permease small subunit|nr:TRAP transporter small permease [Desulfobacterales bacterium]
MHTILKVLIGIRSLLKVLGATALTGMMAITCVDVVGRYLKHPIFGSVEITGFLASLTVILSLAYTHQMNGHIGVELFIRRFSKMTQDLIEIATNIIGIVLCSVITWQMYIYAQIIGESGEVSMNLEFPEHIIMYIASFCFFVLVLTMIEEIATTITRRVGNK